jgi:2-polyprenyl-3-methyl-5-hydroxy-6-metoxy-1,4-benzoquinol methylase
MNFDRTGESGVVAKLEGCFTRGIEYKWDVFRPYVNRLVQGSSVLDMGCGSLVETHYLAQRKLQVTGIDLEARRLADYECRYDWSGLPRPVLRATSVWDLAKEATRFDLIVAFDIIEHLPPSRLDPTLKTLRVLLNPRAILIVTVPNKLSASEFHSMVASKIVRMSGRELEPGVPHLIVKTTNEWKQSFEAAGFEIAAWEMAIGPLVNTWYVMTTGLLQSGLIGLQAVRLISRETRHKWVKKLDEFVLFPRWLKLLNSVDEACRSKLSLFFTWNLVVLKAKG